LLDLWQKSPVKTNRVFTPIRSQIFPPQSAGIAMLQRQLPGKPMAVKKPVRKLTLQLPEQQSKLYYQLALFQAGGNSG